VVLDAGKVVQRGSHDELKEQLGLYATLIED
jgi:ABC-type multidrug transport system fused ATPase/permease subunit